MDELPPKIPQGARAAFEASSLTDGEYEAWTRAKIEAALKEAIEHPDQRTSLNDVWKRFGLEH